MDMFDQSRSALTAAAARAAHLVCDPDPLLFRDPLAQTLLGSDAQTYLAFHRLHGDHPILAQARVLTTFRSRVAEEVVTQAATRGVGQYVLLGAGLDSFA
jgi:O-methyltransferase involved in polyketide biosynthesis